MEFSVSKEIHFHFVHLIVKEDGFHECKMFDPSGMSTQQYNNQVAGIKKNLIKRYNPYLRAELNVNEKIEKLFSAAKHKMDLRIAKFRGNLMNQKMQLAANIVAIEDLPLIGSKVMLINSTWHQKSDILKFYKNNIRKHYFPKAGKVYTIESYINMPRGKGITLKEIQYPIFAVNKILNRRMLMNAPFLLSRFKAVKP